MHYVALYPQNGDRTVTIDFVTSLHPVYNARIVRRRAESEAPRNRYKIGAHFGATGQIRLNEPCAAAMQRFARLLWPLTCWYHYAPEYVRPET